MKFDIAALEQSTRNTFDLIVGHVAGPLDDKGNAQQGAPVGFKILGPSSEEYQKVERQLQIARIKIANRKKDRIDPGTEDGAAAVVDKGDEQRDLVIFACTVGWFGFEDGGQPAAFSRESLARVLKARPAWGRRLIDAIENEANFEGA